MDDKNAYLPTQAEIAKECEAIQRTWSETERRKRKVGWIYWDYGEEQPKIANTLRVKIDFRNGRLTIKELNL